MQNTFSIKNGNFIVNYKLVLILLTFLSLGMDLFSAKFFGLTVRFSLLAPILLTVYLIARAQYRLITKPIILVLLFFSFISLLFSINFKLSLNYYIYLLFIYIFLISSIYSLFYSTDKYLIFMMYINSFRVLSIILIIEYLLKVFGLYIDETYLLRAHAWLYEPSYVAILLCPYLTYSLLKLRASKIDFLLNIFVLVSLQSIFGFLALILNLLIINFNKKSIIKAILICILIILLYFLIQDLDNFYINRLLGAIRSDNYLLIDGLIIRGGIRYPMMEWGWQVFQQNWLWGIGIGADQFYTQINSPPANLYDLGFGISYDELGGPFINIFTATGALMGIIPMIALLIIPIDVYKKYIINKTGMGVELKSLLIGFFIMNILLIFEGTIFRLYYWALYALILGFYKKC